MPGDGGRERIDRIRTALDASKVDALVCALPSNILLLSGYWPVVGTSVAVAGRNGAIAVLAPRDEEDLAREGWAHAVTTYDPGSPDTLDGPGRSVIEPLAEVMAQLGIGRAVIGMESRAAYEGSSYSATYRSEGQVARTVGEAAPSARVVSAQECIDQLRYRLTDFEIDRVGLACRLAEGAFGAGRVAIRDGLREPAIATAVSSALERAGLATEGVRRAGAFAWCMSGPNSAEAGRAYARTRNREIGGGDLVLVHANPYVDGYFADITRTYSAGQPGSQAKAMYEAVFAARRAALDAIEPGVRAGAVDQAARRVIDGAGFGRCFTHGAGHSVGFSAISADFPPRLHPASQDVLEIGCTFNLEPAIYVKGFGGIRHCDVVTLTEAGPEVLTPFDGSLGDLVVSV